MRKISWKSILLLGLIAGTIVIFGAVYAAGSNLQEQTEESGKKLSPTETYDQVHNGVRSVLAFHNASSSFIGSLENTTDKTIKSVRVRIFLSNGTELGPTEPMDLAAGEKAGIKIEAVGQVFTWWKPQVETASDESSTSR
jgi:hypothetical protein